MRRSCPWGFVVASLMLSGPATAQVLWDMPNVVIPKTNFDSTEIKRRPDAWPRLDPGNFLCRTESDVLRLAAFRRKEITERPNCQIIRTPTPIQIVHRAGPGRTQVSLTDQKGQEGWTDAWLPEKAPPAGGKAVSIK